MPSLVVRAAVSFAAVVLALPAAAQTIPLDRADVNRDCSVTQADVVLVQASLNRRCGQSGFNSAADVNQDCSVNNIDLTFVVRSLGKAVCSTPTNTAPTVNAGADQTATSLAASLTGSATDDGLPTNSTLTYAWSQVSGAGTATFAAPTSASTSVTFGAAGTYELRLAVSDGALSGIDTLVVTVQEAPPDNTAPGVNAGLDQSVTLPAAASLNGSATDDGRPAGSTLTYAWSQVGGPSGGTTTFAAPTSASTSVTFSAAGTYELRLTVGDGALSGADTVLVVVSAETTGEGQPLNAAPSVTAIADLTITLPTGATVSGQVADDGLPVGTSVALQWTQVTGPAPAVFATATAASTPVEFPLAGTYRLRITASDGALSSSDDVVVTVRPVPPAPNAAPTVAAGADVAVTMPSPIALSGTVDDDGRPSDLGLVSTWSQRSGPGVAIFDDAGARTTTTRVTLAGTYVFQLLATDGLLTGSDEVTVTVAPAVAPSNGAPTIEVTAPASVALSDAVPITAQVADDGRPTGSTVTIAWTQVSGPATATFTATTGPSTQAAFAQPGVYRLRATATDGAASASDDVEITVAPAPPVNAAPRVTAGADLRGTVGVGLPLTAQIEDDGRPAWSSLAASWSRTTGPGPVLFAAPGSASTLATFGLPGRYVLDLSATDGELVGSDRIVVDVVAAADSDRLAPVITLSGPQRALPGQSITVHAEVADDIGIADVTFVVDGETRPSMATGPFDVAVQIPDVVAPGARVTVRATVRDTSGRTGVDELAIDVTLTPDTQAPTLDLRVPANTSPGAVLTALAVAGDDSGVERVEFFVDDVPVGVALRAPFSVDWTVPPAGGPASHLVRAEAVDASANRTTATRTVPVVSQADTTAPVVTLTAPGFAVAGDTVSIEAVADDQTARTRVFVEGALVHETAASSVVVPLIVPDLAVGTRLRIKADVRDLSGNLGEATREIEVAARPVEGTGMVTGQVVDDRTGLRLAGARVRLVSPDGGARELVTGLDGRFETELPAGVRLAVIELDGYTVSTRRLEVAVQAVVGMVDARLTPRGAATTITTTAAARLQDFGVQIDLPAGAVATTRPMTLASISEQGLAAVLPAGWTPIAAFDLGGGGQFALPVVARVTVPALPAARPLALARWEAGRDEWRVVASDVAAAGTSVEQALMQPGQYVLALADALPVAPPPPVSGALLAGVAVPAMSATDTGLVTPDPRVLFASPDALSLVSAQLTTDSPRTSGLRVQTRLTERYDFISGDAWQPMARLQDVVLYQQPADATTLVGRYPVGPSRSFEAETLQRGVIGVELRVPVAPIGRLVGTGGGIVTAPDDEIVQIEIGPGLVVEPTRVSIQRRPLADLALDLPDGATALDAFAIVLPPALGDPAALRLPRPAGLVDPARVVLARLTDVGTRTHLVLVGLVAADGEGVRVVQTVSGAPTTLAGVRESGTYVLLQASGPLGFAAGRVVDGAGQSILGAVVAAGDFPVVAFTGPGAAYFVAAPAGGVVLSGVDSVLDRRGDRPVVLAAGAVTPATLTLRPVPPAVLTSRPTPAATEVLPDDVLLLTFSEPLAAASVPGAVQLTGPAGPVAIATTLTRGDTALEIRPSASLDSATAYTLTVTASVTDRDGVGLAAPFTLPFTTLDQTAPESPAAGTIAASVPDAGGRVTVRGAQGTAAAGYQVFAENLTRGTMAVALVNPDGSFAAGLLASVSDRLRVRIVDGSGNATTVDIETLRQVNPDGSISQSVAEAGGVVEGPQGTRATVKPGTFPGGAVLTMKPLPVSAFPRQLTPAEQENFTFEKAISLDFGGATPEKYIDVSWPAGPDDKPTDQWVLTESVFVNGEWAMNVTDTVKYRDGRLTTASPPCPGVTAAAVYGLLKSVVPYGLNYAQMYADGRYKLKMSMEVFQGSPIAIPYAAFSTELPRSICFPAFVGRMSISPNTARIAISGLDLKPSDDTVKVSSARFATPLSFARTVKPYHIRVSGYADDALNVYAVGPEGETKVTSIRTKPRGLLETDLADVDAYNVILGQIGLAPPETPHDHLVIVDPADIDVPITALKVVAVRARTSTVVPVRDQLFVVSVPGGSDTAYEVEVSNSRSWLPSARLVPHLTTSTLGEGNLVLRATPGTIDPTREEMGSVSGPARTKLTLASSTSGFEAIEIPPARIVQGGLEFAFHGEEGATYTVITEYDSRPPFALELPTVRYVLRNVNTNQVLKTIFGQAPPKDEPVALPPLTDDDVRPSLLSAPSRMDTFDPAGLLTFRFSESMNPASLRNAIVVRDGSDVVKGEVRISDRNRMATFVPDVPLQLGEDYTVQLIGGEGGASDLAGNTLEQTSAFNVKTFTPRSLGVETGGTPAGIFKDTAWLFRDNGTERKRHLFAVLGGNYDNVRWFDGSNPADPAPLRALTGTASQQRIAAIDTDKLAALGDGRQMLLATTFFNVDRSGVLFFRATEPGSLDEVGGVILSVNPERPGNAHDTVHRGNGYARGVVLHDDEDGIRASVAVENFGVMSVDVATGLAGGGRSQNAYPFTKVKDIARYRDGVVAVGREGTSTNQLVVLGPSLRLIAGPYSLRNLTPTVVTTGERVAIDANRDGEVLSNEYLDVAVVGTTQSIEVVKLSDDSGDPVASPLFAVLVDGTVRQLEMDQERSRVIALVDEGIGTFLQIIDLARGDVYPVDDELDPRIIYRRQYSGANGMRLDRATGLLYISTPSGLDTWLVADRCCDLGVELTSNLDKKAQSVVSGGFGDVLSRELAAIKRGVVLGLERAKERCDGFDVSQLRLLESGSSACLWADDPVRACGSNYQPLVSDHDISTFMPDAWYARKVPDPNWDGEGTAEQVLLAGCVVSALSYPFSDPITEEPKQVGTTGLVFKDISFIPNYSADFDKMEYRLERTIEGLPGDQDNDLAMGRQLLVMKHLTEAYGVDLRGTEGYRPEYDAVNVTEAQFEQGFARFRDITRIPEVEGYEWGVLMQFMLAKAKVYLRVRDAAEETSAFNDFYVKQYHTAAKAAIRATAARIVSHTQARDLFLQIKREDDGTSDGLRIFRRDACLLYQEGRDPSTFPSKPCGSMEEYVAATAARARTSFDLFTLEEVKDIFAFYRVKADEQPIYTEGEADQFIAKTHRWVMRVKDLTLPIYNTMLGADPRADERRANREYAEGDGPGGSGTPGGRIAEFLGSAKLPVKPKVFNRGFMSAPNVYLRAYIAPPGGDQAPACIGTAPEGEDPDLNQSDRCRLALSLGGGTQFYPAYRHKTTGVYMPIPNSQSADAFLVKVDQRQVNAVGHIVFTLDLPERSANEADRTNNVAGTFFYILDPATGTRPPMPDKVPMPVSPQLLAPDPYCLAAPQLEITQSVEMDGEEYLSPVSAYLGAKVKLNIHVTNTGSTPVGNVLACSTLVSPTCSTVGTIAPGATVVRTEGFSMRTTPTNLESVATAEAPDLGVSPTSLLRIGARCEPLILELDPNPNPLVSTVKTGGRVVRHYMAVHPVSGLPAVGVSIALRGSLGTSTEGYTFVSGADGLIDSVVGPSARLLDGLALPARSNGQLERWTLQAVNGVAPECGSDFGFDVQSLTLFPYTQSIEAGTAIRTGFRVFDTGGEADFGGSLRIEFPMAGLHLPEATIMPTEVKPTIDDIRGVTWERKAKVGISGKLGFEGFSAEGEFTGGYFGKAKGLSLNIAGKAAATQAYRYHFAANPTSFGETGMDAPFFALMFPNIAESEADVFRGVVKHDPDGELAQALAPLIAGEEPYRRFRTARIGGFAINATAEALGFAGSIDFIDKDRPENPKGEENQTRPLFSANAGGNAEIGVAYEKVELLEPGVGVAADKATQLIHTIDITGKYAWKSSYATSFEKAEKEIRSGSEPDVLKDKAVELLKFFQSRLTNSETGEADGGIRFRIFADPFNGAEGVEYRPTKLEVGFKTTKTFGFIDDAPPVKDGIANEYRINFVIEGRGQAERVMNEAIGKTGILVQLLTDAQKQRTTDFLNELGTGNVRDLLTEKPSVFTAQDLYDQLIRFVRSLFDESTKAGDHDRTYFYEEVRRGKGEETDLGFNARAKVIGFAVDPLRVEYVSTHQTARGRIVGGTGYLLEDYSTIVIEPPDGKDILLSIIQQRLDQFYDGLGTKLREGWEEYERGKKKGTKADVSASNSIDAKLLDIASFGVKDSPAPSVPTPYRGNSDRAFAGKPRYGIGDFYSLLATDTLSGPVTLTFGYEDAELQGADEATLRLYRWDDAQAQWALMPASIDLAANRVTASLTDVGLYTLAPRMPAGALTWQVASWNVGSGGTTVTLEASGLRMNDGSLLPPGTLVHVQLPGIDPATVSFGSPDASGLPGYQAAADGAGGIRVTVTVPGAQSVLDVRGFSDIGTSFGETTVVRP